MKTTLRRLVTTAVWLLRLAWAAILVYLFFTCPLRLPDDPAVLDTVRDYAKWWLVLSAFFLAEMIFRSHSTSHFLPGTGGVRPRRIHEFIVDRRLMLQGVVGGLFCSLPALAITLVGLMMSAPHPGEWDGAGDQLDLPADRPEGWTNAPAHYLIGVDLSKSNIENSRDPRLDHICSFVETLFASDAEAHFPRPIRVQDRVSLFVFAGESQAAMPRASIALKAGEICAKLKELSNGLTGKADTIVRGSTDVVGFLENMGGEIEQGQTPRPQSVILLFSDFHQDGDQQGTEVLGRRINKVLKGLNDSDGRIIGVSLSLKSKKLEADGTDIRKLLENHGPAGHGESKLWREIGLEPFLQIKDPGHRRALLFASFFRDEPLRPLQLKFQVFPSWRGLASGLGFPDISDYNWVYLGLRPVDDGTDVAARLKIAFRGNSEVHLQPGQFEPYERMKDEPSSLPLILLKPLQGPQTAECDLLIIVPERGLIYTSRLGILSTVGAHLPLDILRYALGLAAVTFIMLAAGACGVDHQIRRLLRRAWSIRWLRRRVPAGVRPEPAPPGSGPRQVQS